MTLSGDYFDRMYAASEDPWDFRKRWYEKRKRALTMATLTRAHYRSIFEPGCSIGELSIELAGRCDTLLASDGSQAAVAGARRRLLDYPNARVEQQRLPAQWPEGEFDLIVISEIGYYFSQSDLSTLLKRAVNSLLPRGALLACHWRHHVGDYPLTGDEVHAALATITTLQRLARHEELDFLLELWSRDPRSPAQIEHLV